SPVEQISPLLPQTLILHSQSDTITPFEGAARFYEEMRTQNVPTQLYTQNLNHHGFYILNPVNGSTTAEFLPIIDQFIKNVFNKKKLSWRAID
ncbi:MAG: prolyl oligopeptidase family serine peptidase, partial [Moorea sp. SIO2B7]|nr:prolyl oligopeptidase family serine peptidase [Moorena sp. SIO2B7]